MSEGRLGGWIDQAVGLFVVLDSEGRVRHANEACLALLGVTPGELSGQDWVEAAVPRPARDEVRTHLAGLLAGGQELVGTRARPLWCADGTSVSVSWSDTVLREGEHITGLLSLGQRTPEHAVAEPEAETMSRRVEELQERNAELQRFARRLSHNVKSPLQSLVGRLDLLLIRPDLGGISRRDAVQAMEAAHTLNEAINDLAATWDTPEASG